LASYIFNIKEFRSIWDSEKVELEDVTCLVGKNEAGKTALLNALYRTAPIVKKDGKFDIDFDYPKREVEDYRIDVESGKRQHTTVVETIYELSDEDIEAVESVFGPKVLNSRELKRSINYNNETTFILDFDPNVARENLATNDKLSKELQESLLEVKTWESFYNILEKEEKTAEIKSLSDLVTKLKKDGAAYVAHNEILLPRLPKFLYFDDYYQMTGRENINALIERQTNEVLLDSDHPLLGLIDLARLELSGLLDVKDTQQLKNKLEGAGNHLTRKILKYWSQNKHIQMRFDVREAKSGDPENMRTGVNIWGEVYDTIHCATTPLGSRSRGFVWFFSFLAWYEDIKKKGENVILLLDEPALSLHGKAQGDLLKYIEDELKPAHQVIYTTHSPFMIDPDHFERVRIVQDRSIETTEPLPREQDGTKVLTEIFEASEDSLFPLQGALGYDIQQSLFIGPNSLIVEGVSDLLYIREMSTLLEREGRIGLSEKWVVTPVGGSGKVPTFVALLAPQKGLKLATLIDFQKSAHQEIEGIYKNKLLKKKNVMTYADFVDGEEADVEDMFDRDFYLTLVNSEYGANLDAPIEIGDINKNIPRIIQAIDERLEAVPMKDAGFSHYRPARYLSENIATLAGQISDATKDRFEAAFKSLNDLL
jgi:predicted ATP-dependent endonuclease of OLD family